ncbi:MAG TPA: LLM class flavin-dependent oxidoreductase [Anaerolineae bacterium]|nr:LLM class flavin-dependent oxidoreductase [Anaerolineae bacterium]
MYYGLSFPNGGLTGEPRTAAELAALAEASGWDGIFLEDYIVWQGHQEVPTYDPWILLTGMALHTERVKLGTLITPLPRRRPWKVAKEAVTLDHLSKGRLIFGAGIGDTMTSDVSFTHFGEVLDTKQRGQMLDEALDILAGLWSGERFHYEGEFYHIEEVTCLPRPRQRPRIPIWIGGGYPLKRPTRRALRWDGSCLYKQPTNGPWEDWSATDVSTLRAMAAQQRGPDAPFDIALGGRHRDEDWDKERALIKSLADAGATWWVEYLPPQLGGRDVIREAVTRGPLRID